VQPPTVVDLRIFNYDGTSQVIRLAQAWHHLAWEATVEDSTKGSTLKSRS
jgi:hypothetical protein